MTSSWSLIFDLGLIGIFLLIAVGIRRLFPILKKFRIPDAIVAGFIGLFVFRILPIILKTDFQFTRTHGNFTEVIAPFQPNRLLTLVFHLMGIAFIALSLKDNEGKGRTRSAVSGGFYMAISYGLQGIVGLGLTLILMKTIFPNIFPSFGFLLPFGFGQGPSLAGEMGRSWSTITNPAGLIGLPNGASVGLSFSTIGFLWACLVGVPLMNILVRRRRRLGEPEPGFGTPPPSKEPARFLVEKEREFAGLARSIDKATTQLMLIGGVYLILFFGLEGATVLLKKLGTMGEGMAKLLWGLHFAFGALLATFVGRFIRKLEAKKILKGSKSTNNYLLQHIGGTAVDFMIAASICAIDVRVLGPYIVPILILTTAGGIATIGYIWFIVRRVWPKSYVEHFVAFFGTHTGTLATGMALLRGVDPEFRTSTASDLTFGSGIGILFGIPLIMMASFPATGYQQGNSTYYWGTFVAMVVYVALLAAIWIGFLKLSKHREKELS